MKKLLLTLTLAMSVVAGYSQAYFGERKFDGEHKNVISGYLMAGENEITDAFYGWSASYTRHLTNRWSVGADMQNQYHKKLYSFDVTGGYRLPVKSSNLYFDGKIHYNRYQKFGFNEYIFNLSMTWESPYVDMRIGESLIHYWRKSDGVTEPLTLTFGFGVNIRNRKNKWNLGLFLRNYDEYYYENWNINWGIRFYAPLPAGMRLFGEFNVRPAGSMSQLANKYEGSGKLGIKYQW